MGRYLNLVEVMGLETHDLYDANVARDPLPTRAFLLNAQLFAVHQVRGSARKGAVGHTWSPVESRRDAGAIEALAVPGSWPRDSIRCSVPRATRRRGKGVRVRTTGAPRCWRTPLAEGALRPPDGWGNVAVRLAVDAEQPWCSPARH